MKHVVASVSLVVGLASCTGEAAERHVTVRDSAGVAIVENDAADLSAIARWSVGARPVVDVGAFEGAEAETLFRVVDAVRLDDGRIAVANAGTSEVRYFDASGAHVETVGGQGGGPGEFQRIMRLIRLASDSLAVFDGGTRSMSVLDPAGAFVRRIRPDPALSVSAIVGTWPGGWVAAARRGGTGELPRGLIRPDLVYVSMTSDGSAVLDTLGVFSSTERVLDISTSGGEIRSVSVFTPPFGRSTTVRSREGRLYVGTQDAPEIRTYEAGGRLVRILRTAGEMQPMTTELVDRFITRRVADVPPEERNERRQAIAALPIPDFVPPYGTFRLDRAGRLWVQDYPGIDDSNDWSIYDSGGVLAARITLPDTFTPYDIGDDWLLGRETDELEVEHVRMYRLNRSTTHLTSLEEPARP